MIARVRVPFRATLAVAADPRTGTIYATNPLGRAVAVISGRTDTVTATVHGGFQAAFGIATDPRTNTIYLADGADQTWVISGRTNAVAATVRVGGEPLAVATDPQAKTIYVTNNGDNTVTVLTSRPRRAAARCRQAGSQVTDFPDCRPDTERQLDARQR